MLEPTRGKNVLDIVLSSQNEFVDIPDIFYHQSKGRTDEKNKIQDIFFSKEDIRT